MQASEPSPLHHPSQEILVLLADITGPGLLLVIFLLGMLLYRMVSRARRLPLAQARQAQHEALLTLNNINSLTTRNIDDRLTEALNLGREYLQLDNGIISSVHRQDYRVISHVSSATPIPRGKIFSLGETYCAITLKNAGITAISHMAASEYAQHPCYREFNFESYIGVPLKVGERIYGTLAFFSRQRRKTPFTEQDREFVTLMANWVSSSIELKLAEEKELQSSAKLEKLTNHAPGMVYQYVRDTDGKGFFPYVSAVVRDIYNADPDALRFDDQTVIRNIHPADLDKVMTSISLSADTLTVWHCEYRYFHSRKGLIWLEGHANPERLHNGSVLWHGVITDISARKRMELNLKGEKTRLQSIIDGTAIGTWEWNIATGITIFNARWAAMIGYSLEELAPTTLANWLSLIHPDDRRACESAMNDHVKGTTSRFDFRYRIRHKAGHWLWVHDRGQIMSWSDTGQPLLMFGTHADITVSVETQEALTESDSRFRSILSSLPGTVYRCRHDDKRSIHYVSERISDLTGYTAEELLDDKQASLNTLILPEDLPQLEGISDALSSKRPYEIFYRLRHKDGSIVWIQDKGSLSYDSKRRTQWLDGFMWDITDRRILTEQLAESEQRFEGAFETAPQGMAIIRHDGRWLDMNTALCDMLGHNRGDLLGGQHDDLTHPDDKDLEQGHVDALLAGRTSAFQLRKRMLHKQGHEIWVLESVSLVYDADDKPSYMIAIVQDISEEMRTDILKRNFVSTVSHELRTPLTAIFGSLGLVTQGALGELSPQISKILGIAYKNAERLIALINDLLDMEKLISGSVDIQISGVDGVAALKDAIEANTGYGEQYGVRFSLADAAPLTLMADKSKLQQVLANLLSNAAKFSHTGGSVTLSLTRDGDKGVIAIADTGEGIPTAFHHKVFEKFSQADSSDIKKKGGTGLGLAISRELVDKMHGRIWFESNVGQGTTFYVALPLAISPADT
ncbi:PAS domain-containing protein [Alcanivorax sp. JB21]|uniref:PAS domain-containing protein n=1 Tax=Alcanivorax limicola TaxID=2874102 RepID=UPI001CBA83FE|nr:PAS domain-containing protein [Alcanivorax limicola]MBZ2188901.1 PAS domain-containing protein [Alcanivorax limicola]